MKSSASVERLSSRVFSRVKESEAISKNGLPKKHRGKGHQNKFFFQKRKKQKVERKITKVLASSQKLSGTLTRREQILNSSMILSGVFELRTYFPRDIRT
jgi:hypothetical protein